MGSLIILSMLLFLFLILILNEKHIRPFIEEIIK